MIPDQLAMESLHDKKGAVEPIQNVWTAAIIQCSFPLTHHCTTTIEDIASETKHDAFQPPPVDPRGLRRSGFCSAE